MVVLFILILWLSVMQRANLQVHKFLFTRQYQGDVVSYMYDKLLQCRLDNYYIAVVCSECLRMAYLFRSLNGSNLATF